MAIARTDRTVRFLGKKEVFDAPVVGQIASAMGGIRVERGTGSDAPLQAAAEALENGDLVAIMPQGTIPRGRAFYDPQSEGSLGRRPPGCAHQGAGHPRRPVGHGAGVAAFGRVPNVLNVVSSARLSRSRSGHQVKLTYAAPTPTRSGS